MTDDYDKPRAAEAKVGVEARQAYEPPVLSPLGNARDILAGTSGPYLDADSGLQDFPVAP